MSLNAQQQKKIKNHWASLWRRFAVLLTLFSAVRLLFFACNYKFFTEETLLNLAKSFAVGIRFDASTIAIFNAPVWVYWTLPSRFRAWKIPNILANAWFIFVNFLIILVNVVDAEYFQFTLRRMAVEIFNQAVMLSEDKSIYIDMLFRYWYDVPIAVISFCALYSSADKFHGAERSKKSLIAEVACFLAATALLIVCIRGGFQRKPLKSVDSNIYAPTIHTAHLVNNSALNIFHTTRGTNLPRFRYFDDADERLMKFSPIRRPGKFCDSHQTFRGKNVFIIILESFSAEHVGALGEQFKENSRSNFTPFLDSLMERSYIFDGFANGTVSIDGLTSVVLSVPPLFNSPYITSAYSGNTVDSLASILKKDGYETVFFYGGKRNSCNFDSFRSKAQIEKYYCQYDYDGPSSDISGWGVYDEEFFQFVARKVNGMGQPFLSILFTLSSHHPYLYPKRLHGKFPKGTGREPLQELIAYTDYSLRKFFETAEKMDWYGNTIFVLVADHTAGSQREYYKNSLGRYSIPLIFFDPNGKLIGKSDEVVQQIDIMPSILDLVGSTQEYFSFGYSSFDASAPRFAISHSNGIYQMITKDFFCRFDGKEIIALHERSDFLLERNLANNGAYAAKKTELQEFLEAFLQWYGNSIIDNKMVIRGEK
jgi:phosphoglycerol transferase MdoB-like AlkP superfamily enzyme